MRAGEVLRGRWGVTMASLTAGLLLLPAPVWAMRHGEGGTDRVGAFQTLEIGPEEGAGDVACLFCTVEVRGDVRGDMAVLFSTVTVEPGREISGDVAGLFSTLRMGPGSRIDGDMSWTLGAATLDAGATVRGERVEFGGSGLSWAVVLAPLLIVVGVVWLLAWGLRRIFAV